MTDIKDFSDVFPSAAPTEAEIEAWEKLSSEEQVRRLRLVLSSRPCLEITDATMDDILAEARERWHKREGHG